MDRTTLFSRRNFMKSAGLLSVAGMTGTREATATGTITLPFENGTRTIAQYPQKRPLILLTGRATQLETPLAMFDPANINNPITPNDAFFVRYHNANFPLSINPATHTIRVTGNVTTPLSLTVANLRNPMQFQSVSVVAVNACSGNSRGFSNPRVTGGQWAHGAQGNATWTGVRLSDVLAAAGIRAGSVQVTFNGLDNGVEETIPDFIKALDVDIATNGEVILAYAMNGTDLPFLNGFPVRLVVPGYTGTYWVKHLSEINVTTSAFSGFYMNTAYREPDNACACETPDALAPVTRPVSHPRVRSFITSLMEGAQVLARVPIPIRGIAYDGGSGIKSVEVSVNGGVTWVEATLGTFLGKYSFRAFTLPFTPPSAGAYAIKVRATAYSGETQPETGLWTRAGYGYNAIETVNITAI